MVSESRSVRIADRIKRDLSLLFLQEISDPRLDGVTVTNVFAQGGKASNFELHPQ